MHVLGISYDALAGQAAGISGIEEANGSGIRIRVLLTRCMVGLPMLGMAACTRLRCVLAKDDQSSFADRSLHSKRS